MQQADRYVAGIDLGGTKVRIALVSAEHGLVRAESWPAEAARGPEAVVQRIAALLPQVQSLAGARGEIAGAGLGVAGAVDVDRGVVTASPNLPGWNDFPVKRLMEQALGLPLVVANDASAGALGEHRYGAGRGSQNMVYITLGTGVGGGLIVNGRLFNGASGAAGEIGHMVLDPNGPPCNCGNRGCLEAFASGGGMERITAARLEEGASSTLQDFLRSGRNVTMHEIAAAARAGDSLARGVIAQGSAALAAGIRNLVHVLNPDRILFGGGLLALADLLIDPAVAAAEQHAFRLSWSAVRFAHAALDQDAGAMGAAAMALDMLAGRPR